MCELINLTEKVRKQATEQIIYFWRDVAQYYKLTDDFLDDYRLWHDWHTLSLFQPFSFEQIKRFRSYIKFDMLSSNKSIIWTKEMIEEIESWNLYKNKLDYRRIALRTDIDLGDIYYKKMIESDLSSVIKKYALPPDFKWTKDLKYDWKKCEILYNGKVFKSKTGHFT